MNKIRLFLSMENKSKKLFIEAFFFLGWARLLKARPFSKVSPALGESMKETSFNLNPTHTQLLKDISHTLKIVSNYTFWESQCLVKAIAAMKMLERRGIESTIYLGTARDEDKKMIAHAWLRSGPLYITGAEGMERFTVVGKFAKYSNSTNEGEADEKQVQS